MRFFILGATEAHDANGRPIPLGGPRVRALLTALALRADRPGPVPVDSLIADIWADDPTAVGPAARDLPPADAPAALQALVGRLRRALGDRHRDAVVRSAAPPGYRLTADPDSIDLFRFQRLVRTAERQDPATEARTLRAALALWRGPVLADLPEPARRPVAARLEALHRTARRRRAAADLALGPAEPLLPELRELIDADPLDEPAHALYIRALRAAGRPAQALAAYETVRTTLADRLGTTPGPELTALYAELLTPGEPAPPAPPGTPATRPPEPEPEPAPAPAPPAGNVRARLTSFVGRESDLAALRTDLRHARLITLTGAGGSGKTRLAEHTGLTVTDYPDGVWIAELAKLDHPGAVPGAVLSALGRRETTLVRGASGTDPHHDPAERLLEYCAGRRLLLILDNCEHVITAAATLAEILLTHCPRLTVLATSREPLGVPGELVRPVEPLPLASAHRLFTERGAAVRRDAPDDDAAVAEICRRLDGLPLAIELAAARLRSLTPRQIAARLDDRFRLLTNGSRTVLPRQQTLRAVVDWSWDLLEEPERTVLRRLSVFAGGCTLPAAEAVVADGATVPRDQVLGILGSLVDKSIVLADTTDPATGVRYRMLETIHEYAAGRAAEHPADRAATRARHTAHLLRFLAQAAPRLRGPAQLGWLARVEADLDNIRALLTRALRAGDRDTAGRAVLHMGWFWYLRNYRSEGHEWIRLTLELDPHAADDDRPTPGPGEPWPDDPRYLHRLELRLLSAFLLADQHPGSLDLTDERMHRHARRMYTAFGETVPERGYRFPGMLWPFTGFLLGETFPAVAARMTRAITQLRRADPAEDRSWELAVMLLFRFRVSLEVPGAHAVGGLRTPRALSDLAELEALAHRVGDRWLSCQTYGLRGDYASFTGDYPTAAAEFDKAISIAEEVGAHAETPFFTVRLAEATYHSGDPHRARALLDEVSVRAQRLGLRDCLGIADYLGAVMALELGDPATARTLRERSVSNLKGGTPTPMFQVIMGILTSRLLLAEGAPWRTALAEVHTALSYGSLMGCPDLLLSQLLLAAAAVVTEGGEPAVARRLLAGVHALRGDLPLTPPEERVLRRVTRAVAGAGPGAADEAPLVDGAETLAVLTALLPVSDS
ncbi:AfsR/SARP family transcriptional regulator [Streptomyces harbinensis]|uniref:AfsR/SARP family transcriptional regulator n=1 Tax=Streptomyces harbinensis TaxID=1176198 RepID=UPI0036C00ADB